MLESNTIDDKDTNFIINSAQAHTSYSSRLPSWVFQWSFSHFYHHGGCKSHFLFSFSTMIDTDHHLFHAHTLSLTPLPFLDPFKNMVLPNHIWWFSLFGRSPSLLLRGLPLVQHLFPWTPCLGGQTPFQLIVATQRSQMNKPHSS